MSRVIRENVAKTTRIYKQTMWGAAEKKTTSFKSSELLSFFI